MNIKLLTFVFILVSAMLLSGCWGRMEVQQLDIVSAIGVDRGSDDEKNVYRVTVQIINEGQVAGMANKSGASGKMPVVAYSAEGSTILDALRKIEKKSPHELFLAHIQSMVVGEELARTDGIEGLFDSLDRTPYFRGEFPVLLVKDNTAEEALHVITPLEELPAARIVSGVEALEHQQGEYDMLNADQVIKQIEWGGGFLLSLQVTGSPEEGDKMSNVEGISPKTKLEIGGLGIFKDGKLQGWMNDELSRGVSWINNDLKQTIVHLDCEGKKDGITVKIDHSSTKVTAKIQNYRRVIKLSIRADGSFDEVQCPIDLTKHKTFTDFEKQLDQEIEREINKTVAYAKNKKNDIFQFGEAINHKDPKTWRKIKKKWQDEGFPETEVRVEVKTSIRRSGLRTNSYLE
ncbi:Ger(x)C family spore germination protein [Domibacillus sp. PGB-M46]|uniref:Ger(x)C family spore germination protein n=1 Tax=Domibacillus sp. PGB-M46 TaxID=2910255 RepID=UPI001F5A7262|nr:Ger(x)C family spore germination protein [Domibacillus sp. PGB-M46]MCI2256288.1 Ger(x)C family spore germination protein [Domibacillus sp. PGB-M46]